MKQNRHTVDQIIAKLRRADVELGQGKKVPEVCKQLQISEHTYYRWRRLRRKVLISCWKKVPYVLPTLCIRFADTKIPLSDGI